MSQPLESYWTIVEPLFELVSIDSPEEFAASRRRVSHASLILFAAHFSLSEIWNGGLLQFFFNSTGLLAPEAIEGFRAIGMPSLADRLAVAVASLGEEFPRDRRARWDAMLVNSGFDEQELEEIFDKTKHQYLAFRTVTAGFDWDRLTEEIYELARHEDGGFQAAATNFANHKCRE